MKKTSGEYNSWHGMIQRCTNPNDKSYKHYGGRGIAVCQRWRTYSNFLADMGHKPSPKHTIDRIDGDKNYEPGNCRWATQIEQIINRKLTIWIEGRLLADLIREHGAVQRTVYGRYRRGLTGEALFARSAYRGARVATR